MADFQCQQCGYELAGLGPVGKCPECGMAYDKARRIGVDSGQRQAKADRFLRRLRTWGLVAAALGVAVLGVAAAPLAATPGRPITVGLFFAVLLLLAALTSYIYERDEV